MKRLFSVANEYVRRSDWKDLALVKFCLCAVGIIIGVLVPATKKKPVGIIAAVVFMITYVLLMPRYYVMLIQDKKK